jgi:hypothetical protein
MTTTAATSSVPSFRMHSRTLAAVRALTIGALCAALTAGFLAQVSSSPAPQQVDATAVAAELASR